MDCEAFYRLPEILSFSVKGSAGKDIATAIADHQPPFGASRPLAASQKRQLSGSALPTGESSGQTRQGVGVVFFGESYAA